LILVCVGVVGVIVVIRIIVVIVGVAEVPIGSYIGVTMNLTISILNVAILWNIAMGRMCCCRRVVVLEMWMVVVRRVRLGMRPIWMTSPIGRVHQRGSPMVLLLTPLLVQMLLLLVVLLAQGQLLLGYLRIIVGMVMVVVMVVVMMWMVRIKWNSSCLAVRRRCSTVGRVQWRRWNPLAGLIEKVSCVQDKPVAKGRVARAARTSHLVGNLRRCWHRYVQDGRQLWGWIWWRWGRELRLLLRLRLRLRLGLPERAFPCQATPQLARFVTCFPEQVVVTEADAVLVQAAAVLVLIVIAGVIVGVRVAAAVHASRRGFHADNGGLGAVAHRQGAALALALA